MKRTTRQTIGILLVVLGMLLAIWGICTMVIINPAERASIGVIDGADGPTAIFVTGTSGPLAALVLLCGTGILPLVLGAVCLVMGACLLLQKK